MNETPPLNAKKGDADGEGGAHRSHRNHMMRSMQACYPHVCARYHSHSGCQRRENSVEQTSTLKALLAVLIFFMSSTLAAVESVVRPQLTHLQGVPSVHCVSPVSLFIVTNVIPASDSAPTDRRQPDAALGFTLFLCCPFSLARWDGAADVPAREQRVAAHPGHLRRLRSTCACGRSGRCV
ncbi:adenylate cyclase type 1 [Lates japonicus]|uniref:Adenylate cyclase type 1 n=1 Tax=Lates japonicus TaxID=270547 RepID=A0AAD3MBE1_LATJO|nr:adenylate cyclase type 1 [Lates japonicus]